MIKLISAGAFSKPKDKSRANQDSILPPLAIENGILFAIADGVGSYEGSGLASSLAIKKLKELIESNFLIETHAVFKSIKETINDISLNQLSLEQSATTLTYCHVFDEKIMVGHVGDCRLYIKSGSKYLQITKDHTQHQKLLDEKLFTKAELKKMSGKNTLTSAISKGVPLDVQEVSLSLVDYADENGLVNLVVMSDGAHHYWHQRPTFSEKTMINPLSFCSSLLKRIERGGPVDDYSLIAIQIKI
ncbi:protein phosphatase [Candidatus Pantoea alvi]|uniref:PP2C family protein-serine/threonine phosphatase n=1 Tax=Enterobacter agglomerans TaxID=549 RepID=UPI000CDDB56B|nr:protein phosphatase 2C domain-containing protein [Pantoea agglomerans]POW57029.1 protein phosphatase [Pantoea alvi]UBN52734.1 protein phosphatase 2C domain-containing protein [Pantoea agglomerans]